MTFNYSLEFLYYILAFAVLLFLLIWLIRLVRVSRQLKSHFLFFNNFFKTLLRLSYFFLLILALMGPGWGGEKREVKVIGKDIFIAVDLSTSMNATDVKPSRLEKIKLELRKILSAFSSDRIGLIIFSTEAFVQCPLTFDKGALNLFIESLGTNLVPSGGTNLEYPISLALDKLTAVEEGSPNNNAKIIILFSDGEDFSENPEEVCEKLKEEGIRLFTIGVGTESGSVIPIGISTGQNKKDENGYDVISKINPVKMKKIASITNGSYFEINDRTSQLSAMINSVNSIAGELQETRMVDTSADKYYYFLYLALFLIILDVLISVKTFRL